MGLSKSKPKPRKGEESKRGSAYSGSRSKEQMEKHSPEGRPPEREAEKPADALLGSGAARHQRPSASSEEKPDAKPKLIKKKIVIPQIIITRASNETLISYCSTGSEEQHTIREQAEWGPYYRHRKPSTVDAYELHVKE